jgi:hypothetical protein
MQLKMDLASRPDTLLTIPALILNNNDENSSTELPELKIADDEVENDSILKFGDDFKRKNPFKRSKNDSFDTINADINKHSQTMQ